jgi:ribosomal protein S6--L-glutamate ligase
MDIVVLSVARGGKVIANPRGTRKLRSGDRLLCFGKLEAMRTLIPPQRRRRIRRLTRKAIADAGGTETQTGA